MKLFRYTYNIIAILTLFALFACTDKDDIFAEGGESVTVTFRPTIAHETNTRAIGDATGIDRLTVAVYEGTETLSKIFLLTEDWTTAQGNGVSLTLIEGLTYNILFWAENSTNTAYELTDDGNITVNYDDYKDGGFAMMEQMDAFCGTSTITVGSQPNKAEVITLARPLAQLNFADQETAPVQGTHKAVVTIHNIPASYNPFDGTVEHAASDNTFTFTDFPEETLSLNNNDYYYLSCNYLFASEATKVAVTFELQKAADGSVIKKHEFKNEKSILITANMKSNVYGNIVEQPVTWSVWDGTKKTAPELEAGAYVIDEASDLAWLSESGATLAENSTFVQTTDINMDDKAINPIKLPAGSTYDGGEKKIINFKNSIFGDATKLIVKNLTIENVAATSTTHVGTLVNTLKGSSTFTNVTVNNSSATTTNGAAGGIVGYIVRTSEKERTETLNVTFNDCKLNSIAVTGSSSEGKFVGLLSGYDNNENLTFDAQCEATNVTVADYTSVYTKANNSAWVTSDVTDKYEGWLGHETYRRAKVTFDGVRLAPKWDGSTKITPITEDGTKLIYSPFDLANCAGTNPGTIKFMENVDLGSKVFNPLTNLSKLIGENKTIYNLKVETTFNANSWDGGGFVRRCSAATIENITFQNADVKVTHVDGTDGDAYASIVCGTAEGTNTITNVKVIGGKLYGCNKMGGIAGYITGTFTATNCVVDGLNIQNYDSGGKDSFGFKANGEVGGAFGFLAANATISGCYVKNTTLNCVGVNNGKVLWTLKYAGRHVNEFIGDIRTTAGQTIRITLDEKNFTGNTYKNRKDQYSGCKYIGHCYYTSIGALGMGIYDTKGTVYVNDNSITVAKNY